MKEEDKNLEHFIDKVMQHQKLEQLPLDFTSKLMQKITVIDRNKQFKYKPLISKKNGFYIISCCVVLLGSYIFANGSEFVKNNHLTKFKLFVNNYFTFPEYTFAFSKISVLAIFFSGIMIFFQFIYLKNHFDNRFEK